MKKGFAFIVLMMHCFVFGQKDYKGVVVNARTNEPIPFVNIGIVGKGVGTVSDEDGLFHLYIDENKIASTENIQFSSLGYQTIVLPVANVLYLLNEYLKIELTPSEIVLNEVVVSNKDKVPVVKSVGYRNTGEGNFGYWKDNDALGGELATRIVTFKERRKLKSLEFEILENLSDSLRLRVNFYDVATGSEKPYNNLNTSSRNILYTLHKNERIVKIDLEPFDIYIENDFYASLELVKRYDDKPIALVLAASDGKAGSYRRYVSQGAWEKISDVNMAFYVETLNMVSQKKAKKQEEKARKAQLELNMVSGFTVYNGRMIPGVEVFNKRTKQVVSSNSAGRYVIHANKNDVLYFSKSGYKQVYIEIGKQQFANAIMQLE